MQDRDPPSLTRRFGRAALAADAGGRTAVPLIMACAFSIATLTSYRTVLFQRVQYDDAYITFRYAVNLAEGKGLVFNNAEKLHSASSLLYTLLLSSIYKLGIHDLESVATIAGLAAGLFIVICTSRFALSRGSSPWLATVFLLPMAMSGSIGGWAVSGMETTFYTALLVGFFHSYAQRRLRASLLLVVACVLTRPEGAVVLPAVAAAGLLIPGRSHKRLWVSICVMGSIVLVGYLTFGALYYGSPLPHPLLMKQVSIYYSPPLRRAAKELWLFFMGSFATICIPGAAHAMACLLSSVSNLAPDATRRSSESPKANSSWDPWLKARSILREYPHDSVNLAMAVFLVLSSFSYLLGPSSDFGRYMTPAVPLLAVCAVFVTQSGHGHIVLAAWRPATLARACLLGIALFLGISQASANQASLAAFFRRTTQHQVVRREIGRWIEKHIPATQVVMSSDIGAIAYNARSHDFLDMAGLTSRQPVDAVRANDWGRLVRHVADKRPLWVADTGFTDGRIQAFEILTHPERTFHGSRFGPTPGPSLYSKHNEPVLEYPADGGFVFRLVRIDPLAWRE